MPLVLNGATSGSTTVTPTDAVTVSLTLPSTGGTLQTSGSGYTTNGVAYATSTSALATGSALQFNSGNFTSTGAAGAAGGEIDLTLTDSTSGRSVTLIRSGATYSYAGIGGAEAGLYTYGNNLNLVADGGSIKFNLGTAGASSEKMRLTSAGYLGIGTSSPQDYLDVYGNARIGQGQISSDSSVGVFSLYGGLAGSATPGQIKFFGKSVSNTGQTYEIARISGISASSSYSLAGGIQFSVANNNGSNVLTLSEAGRFDTSGNLLVGGTSSVSSTAKIQSFSNTGNSGTGYIGMFASGSNLANQQVGFQIGQTDLRIYAAWDGSGNARNNVYVSAQTNGVQLSSGATSWSSISDERQKDIIEPIEHGLTKVVSLRAVIGKYKTDVEGTRRSFLIAQDVKAVLPEAVGIEDAGQESEKLLLAYTDVIPLLVAAIQELSAELNALKAKVGA